MLQRNYFFLRSASKQQTPIPTRRPHSGYSYTFCRGKTKPAWLCFSSKPFKFSFAARGFTWLTYNCVPQGGHLPSVQPCCASARADAVWREFSPATWPKGPQQNEGKNVCHQASTPLTWSTQCHLPQDAPILCISQSSSLSTFRDQTHSIPVVKGVGLGEQQ